MYEIVKKKSTLVRIAYGIIIVMLISAIMKVIFKASPISIDSQLMEVAKEINKHAPIPLDSITKLDNVIALSGQTLQYNYSVAVDKENLDTTVLKEAVSKALINAIKTDPKAVYFRENKVNFQAKYVDKNGIYVCLLKINNSQY